MIHPAAELKFVGSHIGNGVFAREFIPRGTIIYVTDLLDLTISPTDPRLLDPLYRRLIDTYAVVEHDGRRTLSWDNAKYVNHSCEANCLSTGWGFELVVEDIPAGVEITDDYGLFNLPWELHCACGAPTCRGIIQAADFERLAPVWDRQIQAALPFVQQVPQPLWPLLEPSLTDELLGFLSGTRPYPSVWFLHQEIGIKKAPKVGSIL